MRWHLLGSLLGSLGWWSRRLILRLRLELELQGEVLIVLLISLDNLGRLLGRSGALAGSRSFLGGVVGNWNTGSAVAEGRDIAGLAKLLDMLTRIGKVVSIWPQTEWIEHWLMST